MTSISEKHVSAIPPEAAGRFAPLMTTCDDDGVEIVAPEQVVVGFAPAGTVTFAGRLSVTLTFAAGWDVGL